MHLAMQEGDGNVLNGLESFRTFSWGIRDRITGCPEVTEATLSVLRLTIQPYAS